MDPSLFQEIAQWLFPSGFALTAIGWMVDRRLHRARASKETHEAYKSMYDDLARSFESLSQQIIKLQTDNIQLKGTLTEIQEVQMRSLARQIVTLRHDNERLNNSLSEIKKAVQLAFDCRYFRSCPILARLPNLAPAHDHARPHHADAPDDGQHADTEDADGGKGEDGDKDPPCPPA